MFNSETYMEMDNDLTQLPTEDQSVDYMGNLFVLADGQPHRRNIAITGTTISVAILTVIGGICCWCKNPVCLRRICFGCSPRGIDTQERKDRLVNNILNQIREGMDVHMEATSGHPHQPPPPPDLEI